MFCISGRANPYARPGAHMHTCRAGVLPIPSGYAGRRPALPLCHDVVHTGSARRSRDFLALGRGSGSINRLCRGHIAAGPLCMLLLLAEADQPSGGPDHPHKPSQLKVLTIVTDPSDSDRAENAEQNQESHASPQRLTS